MYLISFYVPESFVTPVTQALFTAGAGRIGNYDSCAWTTGGQGQFRPLPGSRPFIGETDAVETVPEMKVELVCRKDILKKVLRALIESHPYESPAYHAIPVVTLENL